MAKTESTAVNQLIENVQTKTRLSEPGEDLFNAPKSTKVNPPRMTSTVPAMRGAGEVAPLPRGRAPQSTSNHSLPAIPPPVRMSTGPVSRGTTIPPISNSTPRIPTIAKTASSPAIPGPRSSPRGSLPPPVRTTPPATAPVAAPFEAKRAAEQNPFAAMPQPFAPQQFPIVPRPDEIDVTADVVRADNWFEVSAKVHKLDDETWVGTSPTRSKSETLALIKKLIAPTILLAIIMVGGYFAFNGQGSKKKPTPKPTPVAAIGADGRTDVTTALPPAYADQVAPSAQPSTESPNAGTASAGGEQPQPPTKAESLPPAEAPTPAAAPTAVAVAAPTAASVVAPSAAPAAAPTAAPVSAPTAAAPAVATTAVPSPVREVKTPRGVVKLVDVRIDSKPAGATVMLVDNGKTSFLGSTPIATSLDPSRTYDVILSREGRLTQMAHLDPTKTSRISVKLERPKAIATAAPTTATEAPAVVAPRKPTKKEPVVTGLSEPFFDEGAQPAKVEKKAEQKLIEKKIVEPAAGGEGTLMVSSKPPCEIYIDGKATGLTTPQRSIPLSAGTHKITFVNTAEKIKKTVSVSITADQSTKLIQDLLAK